MSGYTILLNKKNIQLDLPRKAKTTLESNKIEERIEFGEASFYRHTNNKFLYDKAFNQKDELFIVFEGILLNKEDLTKKKANISTIDLYSEIYTKKSSLLNQLRGEWSGAIYNKIENNLIAFTNQTSSKPVFYYNTDELFILSSELKSITDILHINNIKNELDEDGAVMLLTYGYMLEDYTLIKGIKKLKAGYYLELTNNKLSITKYHEFKYAPLEKSKEYYIEELDKLFTKAVHQEYLKDKEYNYKHFSTLSGGLDSRMNIMIANKLKFDTTNFCASQNNYLDEKIAKKISSDLKNEFLFTSLNNGIFLYNIDRPVNSNDGLVFYSGSAHILDSLKNINFNDYGLVHTGMLGDGILGNFVKDKKDNKLNIKDGLKSDINFKNIELLVEKIQANYDNKELFLLYNKGFNAVLNGYLAINMYTEASAPFLDVDFLEFCLTIPNKYRYNEKIYREWILKKHPNIAKYRWETTGLPLRFGPKVRYFTRGAYYILNNWLKLRNFNYTMIPINTWYIKNKKISETYNDYYNRNISLLNNDKIKIIVEELFNSKNPSNLVLPLTLLSAIKLHKIS